MALSVKLDHLVRYKDIVLFLQRGECPRPSVPVYGFLDQYLGRGSRGKPV